MEARVCRGRYSGPCALCASEVTDTGGTTGGIVAYLFGSGRDPIVPLTSHCIPVHSSTCCKLFDLVFNGCVGTREWVWLCTPLIHFNSFAYAGLLCLCSSDLFSLFLKSCGDGRVVKGQAQDGAGSC